MEEMVTRAQEGDLLAMEYLYREYRRFIYNYILKRVKNETMAEDITSEVFMRVLTNLDKYRYKAGYGFVNWLCRVAHNTIVDAWRKQNRDGWVELDVENADDIFEYHPSAEEEALFTMDEEGFQKFLDYCTPSQREVIALKYLHDMTNEQVAKELGLSVGAVKSMQHRAFDKIKVEYEADEV